MSAVVGGLITNILVVNNLRDLESDREAGKITLAAAVGPKWTRLEYIFFSGIAYGGPAWLILGGQIPQGAGAVLLGLPWSVRLIRQVISWKGSRLNRTLAESGLFALGYVVLFGLGGSLFQ
jgi:1,4-dihydroxy-2-naphthoate octaprenyltransferase